MKFLTSLILAIAVTVVTPINLHEQWLSFKTNHSKTYDTPSEENRRLEIFQENLIEIQEHNEKFANGETTWKKAINQFGDLTKEEFRAFLAKGKITKPTHSQKLRKEYVAVPEDLQSEVDWRAQGAVTEVKDQGQCGSCWSFSATGSLEGQLAIQKGRLISLSEQNLIDCSSGYGNEGCDGGFMGSAFDYVHNYGIESETDYPYEARTNYCRYQRNLAVTGLSQYYAIPEGDEAALLNAVAKVGPVSVAIDATEQLQFYAGGVFIDRTCDSRTLNHGVLVVGYGTHHGKDYWLVKNSWGHGWGEDGYYKAIRNYENSCGIASDALYPVL